MVLIKLFIKEWEIFIFLYQKGIERRAQGSFFLLFACMPTQTALKNCAVTWSGINIMNPAAIKMTRKHKIPGEFKLKEILASEENAGFL